MNVTVFQWIMSCLKYHMTTLVITLWGILVASLTTSGIFFSIFGKGPWSPLVWEFYRCLTTNWEKKSNENVSNFLQMVSRITCSHIILYHLTLN